MSSKNHRSIVSDDESVKNLFELKKYVKSIVPFVGAGMSAPIGYKTWLNFLLNQLTLLSTDTSLSSNIEKAFKTLQNKEYLEAATQINTMLNGNLAETIRREYSPKENEEEPLYIEYLRRIGCTTVLTTNYDAVLEMNMHIDEVKPEAILPYSSYDVVEKDKQGTPVILKLHGNFDNPTSIVITKEQYKEKYVDNDEICKSLQYFWTSKVLLFMGCSLEKDYLVEYMFNLAKSDNKMYHYAILPEPVGNENKIKKQIELDRLKIRPIWYPDGKHENIIDILDVLLQNNYVITEFNKREQPAQKQIINVESICKQYLDNVALLCKKKDRNKLFCSILNTNSKLKSKLPNISSIISYIYNCKEAKSLCISGEPGTGKSTLLSLLYLEFLEKKCEYSLYTPLYVNLHNYDIKPFGDAVKHLKDTIDLFRKYIEAHTNKKALLFVDGLDDYKRCHQDLIDIVIKFSEDKEIIAKTVYAVGTMANKMFPRIKNFKATKGFERTIKICQINTQRKLFYQITEQLLRIYNILPNPKDRSKVTDKIRNLSNMASGNCTDFRTINFLVLQYNNRNEILDLPIGEVFAEYYSTSEATYDLDTLAEKMTRLMFGQCEKYESEEIIMSSKSSSIRNFMYAHFYIQSITEKKIENMQFFDSIFPPCVNGFAKSLINADSNQCSLFIEGAIEMYNVLSAMQQNQILYMLGRVKYRKERAIEFIQKEYELLFKQIDWSMNALIKFRTSGIALIYAGDRSKENHFYENIIYHPKLRRMNRLFHMDYYINDAYEIGEKRNLTEIVCDKNKIERLYYSLYNNIVNKPKKGQHFYLLSIITIIDLVIYDHYRAEESISLFSDEKYGFNELVSKLEYEENISNHIVKSHIASIGSGWDKAIEGVQTTSPIQDDNVYRSLVFLLYRLKKILRSGWLKDGRRVDLHQQPESVADHTWGCGIIAMILLSEDISLCSFMQHENLDGYKDYNKLHIIELLLVHDLAETYTGDVSGKDAERMKMEKEFIDKIKAFDSFPYFRSFNEVSKLINEYSITKSINSQIAYDIDKIEPLIQLYIYKDLLANIEKEIPEWEHSVDKELKTTLGRKIYAFILHNIKDKM